MPGSTLRKTASETPRACLTCNDGYCKKVWSQTKDSIFFTFCVMKHKLSCSYCGHFPIFQENKTIFGDCLRFVFAAAAWHLTASATTSVLHYWLQPCEAKAVVGFFPLFPTWHWFSTIGILRPLTSFYISTHQVCISFEKWKLQS